MLLEGLGENVCFSLCCCLDCLSRLPELELLLEVPALELELLLGQPALEHPMIPIPRC